MDRFNAAPDKAAQLVTLKALADNDKKRASIEAGGWATMPGAAAAPKPARSD